MFGILSGLLEQFWGNFFSPTIKLNFPPQTVDGEEPGYQALANGEIVEMTPRKIVFEDDSGNKLTLKGEFYLIPESKLEAGGDIGGTIKGFSIEDDGTEVASGHSFKIDAAYFFMAIDDNGPKAGVGMFYEDAEVYKGSQYGDTLYVEARAPEAPLFDAQIAREPEQVIIVKGLAGDDQLIGGEGRQILKGGKDSDTLFGGYDDDQDILVGGADGDFFLIPGIRDKFELIEEDPRVDHIKDFSSEDDTIVFVGEIRGGPAPEAAVALEGKQVGFIGEEQFHQGPMATTEDHRFIYNKGTGELFVDQDGSGEGSDQMLIATLKPGTHVESSDIYVGDGLLMAT